MKSAIAWFVRNPVAANLLTVAVIVGGLLAVQFTVQETFPQVAADAVSISVIYPGASPEDVENGICIPIEEEIHQLSEVQRLSSIAADSACTVIAEVSTGSLDSARRKIKNLVEAIDRFPVYAEEPIIQDLTLKVEVLYVAVSGDLDPLRLQSVAERVRDHVGELSSVAQAVLIGAKDREISIDLSETALRRHGLTFDEVASAVRTYSLDLPGGLLKTASGNVRLRVENRADRGAEFAELPLRSRTDGTRLLLRDVASVQDGFEDVEESLVFDGQRALMLEVQRAGDESATTVAHDVRQLLDRIRPQFGDQVDLTIWQDRSTDLSERHRVLLSNAWVGLLLVVASLTLFLRFSTAVWVCVGIVVAFMGGLMLLPLVGASINLISMFGFILALGLVVDDAIVVGESIAAEDERNAGPIEAAILGASRVGPPVSLAALTTIAFVAPMLLIDSLMGRLAKDMPMILIACLIFSLAESLFMLPSHLGSGKNKEATGRLKRLQDSANGVLKRFTNGPYIRLLRAVIDQPQVTVAIGMGVLMLAGSIAFSGWIKFSFFPVVEGRYVTARVSLPVGTPFATTQEVVSRIESAVQPISRELKETGESEVRHVFSAVGSHPSQLAANTASLFRPDRFQGAHLGEIQIELDDPDLRTTGSSEIAQNWRDHVGDLPSGARVVYSVEEQSLGADLEIQLSGGSLIGINAAAAELAAKLGQFPGVTDVSTSTDGHRDEIQVSLTRRGELAGVSVADLARQVRQGFFGEEIQRVQRGRDEIEVAVRYPKEERDSFSDLDHILVRTPDGAALPFSFVARAEPTQGPHVIERTDRTRTVNVSASVDSAAGNANEIMSELENSFLSNLESSYPGVSWNIEGEQRDQSKTLARLGAGWAMALLFTYALLAVPLRSYFQPFLILAAIPFGIVGAVVGHVVMGMDLSGFSLMGLLALGGVVVNDALILLSAVNDERERGLDPRAAIEKAAVSRVRPILLTSLTTFLGLVPLLLDQTSTAQFLHPIAVTIAFGVLVATLVTLTLVPAAYILLEGHAVSPSHSGIEDGTRIAKQEVVTPSIS